MSRCLTVWLMSSKSSLFDVRGGHALTPLFCLVPLAKLEASVRSPNQLETLASIVSELTAKTDIMPNESLDSYVARQLQRTPQDAQVDAYIRDIRKYAGFAGHEYAKETPEAERMGDYWLTRVIELLGDLKASRPAPVEFLSSVPQARERMG